MHEPGFVGRTRELANLDSHFTAAVAGRGALVLVEGEAGAGKTALAQAFVLGVALLVVGLGVARRGAWHG